MATRSLITIKNPDSTYDAVYCHFDGYPQAPGVGHILKQHYGSENKIRELISLGGMSALGSEIKDCDFYKDRGEKVKNFKSQSWDNLMEIAKNMWCEYIHIFSDKWGHVEI
jgi:hypothetical protein